jgi:sec-independent protein translocase protein TatA
MPNIAPAGFYKTDRKADRRKGDFMLEGLLQPMHLLVIFGIALLIFGPKKLPELGKGLGESIRGFKSAMAQAGEKNSDRKITPES